MAPADVFNWMQAEFDIHDCAGCKRRGEWIRDNPVIVATFVVMFSLITYRVVKG